MWSFNSSFPYQIAPTMVKLQIRLSQLITPKARRPRNPAITSMYLIIVLILAKLFD